MSDAQANEAEKNIEIWKVKKLIKRLEAARGNGTSMISLIIRKCLSGAKTRICAHTYLQLPRTKFPVRRRCWQKNTYGTALFSALNLLLTMDAGTCFKHQVARQSSICALGNHFNPAETEAVQQSAAERVGGVLR
jgi:hypothetical protein